MTDEKLTEFEKQFVYHFRSRAGSQKNMQRIMNLVRDMPRPFAPDVFTEVLCHILKHEESWGVCTETCLTYINNTPLGKKFNAYHGLNIYKNGPMPGIIAEGRSNDRAWQKQERIEKEKVEAKSKGLSVKELRAEKEAAKQEKKRVKAEKKRVKAEKKQAKLKAKGQKVLSVPAKGPEPVKESGYIPVASHEIPVPPETEPVKAEQSKFNSNGIHTTLKSSSINPDDVVEECATDLYKEGNLDEGNRGAVEQNPNDPIFVTDTERRAQAALEKSGRAY